MKEIITYRDEDHSYKINEIPVACVTDILREFGLATDYSHVPSNVMESARLLGEYGHDMCKLYFTKQLNEETLDPILKKYLIGVKKFEKDFGIEPIEVETPVGSLTYGVAGTPDLDANTETGRTIFEYKFQKKVTGFPYVQVNGYRFIKNLLIGKTKIKKTWVIQFLPGAYQIVPQRYSGQQEEEVFKACLTIRNRRKK